MVSNVLCTSCAGFSQGRYSFTNLKQHFVRRPWGVGTTQCPSNAQPLKESYSNGIGNPGVIWASRYKVPPQR